MITDRQRQNRLGFIHQDEQGFSLLEAVFAMMILAFGLLGLAGMQTVAMSFNTDAAELTRASNLAAEMIERIHSNRLNVSDYAVGPVTVNAVPLGTGIDTLNAATEPGVAQATARGDYGQWQANLNNSGLTNARGTAIITSPFGPAALNQSQVVVTVWWMTKKGDKKVERQARVALQTVVTSQ